MAIVACCKSTTCNGPFTLPDTEKANTDKFTQNPMGICVHVCLGVGHCEHTISRKNDTKCKI